MDRAVGQTNKRRLIAPRNRPSRTACGNLRLLPPGSKTKGGKGGDNWRPSEEEGHMRRGAGGCRTDTGEKSR